MEGGRAIFKGWLGGVEGVCEASSRSLKNSNFQKSDDLEEFGLDPFHSKN